MATATVINIKGEVFAVNKEGVKRRLQNGDKLQEGEVLVTAPGSSAELDMGGGKTINVPEQQTFMVDGSTGGPAKPDAATSALESAAAAQKVIQALASGDANALLEAEAAAAGLAGGADGGGSSFVQLLRISEDVTPVSYEYGSFSQGGIDQPTPGAIEEIPNNPPTIGVKIEDPEVGNGRPFQTADKGTVWEAGLDPNGSDNPPGSDREFVFGEFRIGDPEGLADLQFVTINGTQIAIADLGNNNVIPGAYGTLIITSYADGIAHFTYELTKVTTDINQDVTPELDVFMLTVSDSEFTSGPAEILIEIVDDLPQAQDDTASPLSESANPEPLIYNVLDNDTGGADGGKTLLSATLVQGEGTVSFDANGEITFTPAAGFDGQAIIEYTMRDADLDESSAQLTVEVEAGVPEATVAIGGFEGDALMIPEDGEGTFTVTATASDATDRVATIELAALVDLVDEGWTVDVAATTGSGSYDPLTGVFTVTGDVQEVELEVTLTPPGDSSDDVLTVLLSDIEATVTVTDIGDPLVDDTDTATVDVDVDAILDEAVQVDNGSDTIAEDADERTINLGLNATQLGVTLEGQDDGAGDANETGTVTITTDAELVLPVSYTGGAVLAVVTGGYELSGWDDLADLVLAIEALSAVVPAGFDGDITGTVDVEFDDPTGGDEDVAGNNTYTDSASFTLTVEAGVPEATVAIGGFEGDALMIPEDGEGTFTVTATASDATDRVATIELAALVDLVDEGWTVDVAATTGSGSYDPLTGVFTVTGDVQEVELEVTLTPPGDSSDDVLTVLLSDIEATVTVTDIGDPLVDDTDTATVDVDVDAILDEAVQVDNGSDTIAEDADERTINLGLNATQLGVTLEGQDDGAGDANETGTVTITTDAELVLPVSYTGGAVLAVVTGGYELSGWDDLADLVLAIEALSAVVPAGFDGTISGTVDVEFDDPTGGDEDVAGNNTYTDSASFTLTVTNTPPQGGGDENITVDEDGLPFGIAGGTLGDVADEITHVTGVLGYDFTVNTPDATTPFTWTDPTGTLELYSNGELVTFEITDNGRTLTGLVTEGTTVFVLTVTDVESGAYSFELLRQLDNSDNVNNSEIDDLPLSFDYTILDDDGETAGGTLNVTVNDDSPFFTSADHGIVANTAITTVTGNLVAGMGADKDGSTYSLQANEGPTTLTSGSALISYYVDPSNPDQLIAYYTDSAPLAEANQVFKLDVNDNGTYTFTVYKAVDAQEVVPIGGSSSFGSGPTGFQVLQNTSGGTQNLAILSGWVTNAGFAAEDFTNWLDGQGFNTADTDQAAVNGNDVGWGIDNSNLDGAAGEALAGREFFRIDFDDVDPFGSFAPTAPVPAMPKVTFATIELSQFKATDLIAYVIYYQNDQNGTYESANGTVSALSGGDNILVLGTLGRTIDYIEFMAITGNGKFDLVDVSTVSNTGTTNLTFDLDMIDADGDTASGTINVTLDGSTAVMDGSANNDSIAGNSLNNTLNGLAGNDKLVGGDGNDTLNGGDNDDTLQGGAGDDLLVGGAGIDLIDFSEVNTPIVFTLGVGGSGAAAFNGNDTYSGMEGVIGGSGGDTLTGNSGDNIIQGGKGSDMLAGGGGNDTFKWGFGDQGAGPAPIDTISDFNLGDKIDLRDLLQGEHATGESLSNYLEITYDGDTLTTIINVSTTGNIGDGYDQQILVNDDLTDGSTDQTVIINALLAGKLITDA